VVSATVPAAQARQAVWPVAGWYRPAVQGLQAEEAGVELNDPALQSMHVLALVAPDSVLYLPAAQAVQALDAVAPLSAE